MPIKTPRLHCDRKSGGYFFRYKLPAILAERLEKVSVYQSLKTKDFAVAKGRALYLNLQLEMTRHKLDPNKVRLDGVKELLKIDLKNGVFEADDGNIRRACVGDGIYITKQYLPSSCTNN